MMRGWLLKKGPKKNISSWKKRYFVLSRHTKKLNYYEDEKASDLIGTADMAEALYVMVPNDSDPLTPALGIEVVTAARVWQFCLEDEEAKVEHMQWLNALKRLVPPTITTGWLYRSSLSGWKERFCVLNQNGISFWEDEKMTEFVDAYDITTAINVVKLQFDGISEYEQFGVQIVCVSPQQLFALYTTNEREQDRWIHWLQRLIPQFHSNIEPLKSGYLTKRGDRVKNWKRRFFALLDGMMLYFESIDVWKKFVEEESQRTLGFQKKEFMSKCISGVIPLRGSEVLLDVANVVNKDGFAIKTKNRTFYLKASNETERREWIDAVNRSLFFTPFQSKALLDKTTAFTPQPDDDEEMKKDSAMLDKEEMDGMVGSSSTFAFSGASNDTTNEQKALPPLPMFLDIWKQKLNETLTHPVLSQYFQRYFKEIWDNEVKSYHPSSVDTTIDHHYLDFWMQAQEFSLLKDSTYRKNLAAEIFQRFFAHGADAYIHIPSKLFQELSVLFANPFDVTYKFASDLFRNAQEHVLEMLAADVFPYFLLSESEYSCNEAIRKLYDDHQLIVRLKQTFKKVQSDSKLIKLTTDPKFANILRNSKNLEDYIKSLGNGNKKNSANNVQSYKKGSFFVASASNLHPELLSGTLPQPGVITTDIGFALITLWKALDEYNHIHGEFREIRAYSIYEEFLCLCAANPTRIPEELSNTVIQNLVKVESDTFQVLNAVITTELRDRYVTPFMTSHYFRRGFKSNRNESMMMNPHISENCPSFESIMHRTHFREYLRKTGGIKYWTCWRDMEDFRLYPFQNTEADRWCLKRRADQVFTTYFSVNSSQPIDAYAIGLNDKDIYSIFSTPSKKMFIQLQSKLNHYLRFMYSVRYMATKPKEDVINKTKIDPNLPPPLNLDDDVFLVSDQLSPVKARRTAISLDSKNSNNSDSILGSPSLSVSIPPPTADAPKPPTMDGLRTESIPPPPPNHLRTDSVPPPPMMSPTSNDNNNDNDNNDNIPPPPPNVTENNSLPPMHQKTSSIPPPPPNNENNNAASPPKLHHKTSSIPPPPPTDDERLQSDSITSTTSSIPPPPPDQVTSPISLGTIKEVQKIVITESKDDENEEDIVPFKIVVGDRSLSRHFKHFMSRSKSSGSLIFYYLVEEYSRLPMSGDLATNAPALAFRHSLYKNFVSDDAVVELPAVNPDVRKEIKRFMVGHPRPWTFHSAQAAVYEFLENIFYKPFRRSHFYKELLDEYKNIVLPRRVPTVNSYWDPKMRLNAKSMDNLSCYNSSWIVFFKMFLERTFCAENYHFFVAVDDFRYAQGHNYRQILARRIFDEFISRNSATQVNIPGPMYGEILKNFEECPRNLFHKAQIEIYNLLKTDGLASFTKEPEFKAYIGSNHLPSPSQDLTDDISVSRL